MNQQHRRQTSRQRRKSSANAERKKQTNEQLAYKPQPPKSYGVVFFDTFVSARSAKEEIVTHCQAVDQLNLVIQAEGNMDDPELLDIDKRVKVFAGAAWWSIHQRRKEEGWYDEPR